MPHCASSDMFSPPKKNYKPLERPGYVALKHEFWFLLVWVIVVCPLCGSDLSINQISQIEGLEHLSRLINHSLQGNQNKCIEGI